MQYSFRIGDTLRTFCIAYIHRTASIQLAAMLIRTSLPPSSDKLECRTSAFDQGKSALRSSTEQPTQTAAEDLVQPRPVVAVALQPPAVIVRNVGTHRASLSWASISVPSAVESVCSAIAYQIELAEQVRERLIATDGACSCRLFFCRPSSSGAIRRWSGAASIADQRPPSR